MLKQNYASQIFTKTELQQRTELLQHTGSEIFAVKHYWYLYLNAINHGLNIKVTFCS